MNSEMAGKMLAALADDSDETEIEEVEKPIPVEEQKNYLMRNIGYLKDRADKKAIGNILVMNDKRSSLQWCSEGTIINLDALPSYIVTQMYELLRYKMEKPK